MIDNPIQKTVSKSNFSLMTVCILGMVAVFGVGAFFYRYFYNFLLGPFDVEASTLSVVESADKPLQYWLKVPGDEMINTGFQYYTSTDNGPETVEATYFAMILEGDLLLVRLNGDVLDETLPGAQSGWLEALDSDEKDQIIAGLETEEPEIAGLFLPYKLQTGNFRTGGFIGIAVGLVIILGCLWGLLVGIRRMSDPSSHPVMKRLARFGPLEFVISRIEGELASPHTQVGKLHFTNSWMVYIDNANLMATRYEDVVWVYKHVFTQRTYGIVTMRTYTAMVADRHGELLNFVAGTKEKAVDEMLNAIFPHTPWAVIGFSNEIEKAWKKDRQHLIDVVDQRKAGGSTPVPNNLE